MMRITCAHHFLRSIMYKRKFIIVILIGVIFALKPTDSPILSQVACQTAYAETIEQNPNANDSSTQQPAQNDSIFNRIFGSRQDSIREQESWRGRVIRAFISFSLAALLAAGLAFRPRKNLPIF